MHQNEITAIHLIASAKGWELSDFCPERDTEPEGISDDGVNFHPISANPEDWNHIWTIKKSYDGVSLVLCFSGSTVAEFVSALHREAIDYDAVKAAYEEIKLLGEHSLGPSEFQRVQIKLALVKEAQDLADEINIKVISLADDWIQKTMERLLGYALPREYCEQVVKAISREVCEGVCEAVNGGIGRLKIGDFNDDDVRLEIGRVLISKLKA